MMTNVAHQPAPVLREPDHQFFTSILSLSSLHLMKKKEEENMTTQQGKEEEFCSKGFLEKIAEVISIQGFHSIYR